MKQQQKQAAERITQHSGRTFVHLSKDVVEQPDLLSIWPIQNRAEGSTGLSEGCAALNQACRGFRS